MFLQSNIVMKLNKDLEIIGKALWFEKEKTLIIADLHIGYEEYLIKKGIFVPKQQYSTIIDDLKLILKKIQPTTIVINGDLKQEFGKILTQEWKDVLNLLDFLKQNCQNIILIKGNHDRTLQPISSKREIKIVDNYEVGDYLIVHGDLIVPTTKNIIIGHEHPAIVLKDNQKQEKYKCFLIGDYNNKELIVMPSFNPLIEGTDVLKEKLLSPYLKNISDYEVIIVNENLIYPFGKIKNL
jgi:uncharacterized protein